MTIKRHETFSRQTKNFACEFSFANSCRQIHIFCAKFIISSHFATMAIGSANPASKVWDALTWRKKMLTLPSPTPPPPSPTSPDPGDGVNRSKFNFFPEQHQHKPTKTFVRGQHARIQDFFVRGRMGGGVWGGGGGPGPSTLFTVYRGVQWI